MKCEICHKADAEVAIPRPGSADEDDELYVCKACADQARRNRQKKSQRTRKISGLPPGVSMSVTEISSSPSDGESGDGDGLEPPPIIGAIMNAFENMARDLGHVANSTKNQKGGEKSGRGAKKVYDFPLTRVDRAFRYGGRLHLEGLHLIGELDAVKRAMKALGYELVGVDADGVITAGHVFGLRYVGSTDRARRVVEDLIRQERNARVRLYEEMARIFGDSLCRALAILKNCRLLAPGELFDLLSPLRLAALENMLDGISLAEIEALASEQDLSSAEDHIDQAERDRIDAERADAMNSRFDDVVLNERAEGKYL